MSSKHTARGDSGEYAFTRAAYDEVMDAEIAYDVEFLITLQPTRSKGVWLLTTAVLYRGGRREDGPVVSYAASWPNSTVQSFGAFLYGAHHRTCRMVEAWYNTRMESEREAPMRPPSQ